MLRLDWNILFNIINLIILYFLMKRFLFKPVNAILEKRQQEADSQFAEAAKQKQDADQCRQQYEGLLKDAQSEKDKIVAQARTDASTEYGRIVEEAKGKAETIVAKAKDDAESEKAAILQQADEAVKDLVVTAAARMTGMKENPESDRALYDKFIAQAK